MTQKYYYAILIIYRDLILVQHQYNNCTTTPHMRVDPSMWDPPSCEGLLYSCCIGIVNLTFSLYIYGIWFLYNTNTTTVQQLGPTLMWGVIIQLLYWCCKSNIFLYIYIYIYIYILTDQVAESHQLEVATSFDIFCFFLMRIV